MTSAFFRFCKLKEAIGAYTRLGLDALFGE